jgi:hypothetical protein
VKTERLRGAARVASPLDEVPIARRETAQAPDCLAPAWPKKPAPLRPLPAAVHELPASIVDLTCKDDVRMFYGKAPKSTPARTKVHYETKAAREACDELLRLVAEVKAGDRSARYAVNSGALTRLALDVEAHMLFAQMAMGEVRASLGGFASEKARTKEGFERLRDSGTQIVRGLDNVLCDTLGLASGRWESEESLTRPGTSMAVAHGVPLARLLALRDALFAIERAVEPLPAAP